MTQPPNFPEEPENTGPGNTGPADSGPGQGGPDRGVSDHAGHPDPDQSYPGQPPESHGAAGSAQGPPPAGEEQGIGVAIHLGGLVTTVVVPLVLWLAYRERSALITEHGRAALNWQMLMLAGYLASLIIIALPIPLLGGVLNFAVFVISAIFAVLSAIEVYYRRPHKYPFDPGLVK